MASRWNRPDLRLHFPVFRFFFPTWLENLRIHAYAVMGHSLGEISEAGMFTSQF